jgi:FKBP-type peptidyl-prolyl cis-trans isomerase (trigger factor)
MKDFPMQREWFVDQAKRRVSLGLILSEIVKVNKLQASRIRSRRSLRNRRRATSIRKK